jgi:hypothetical protein
MIVAQMLLVAALQQAPAVAPTPDRVVVTPAAAEVEVDSSREFRAEVQGADGRPIDGAQIRWIVPEDEVAVVDEASGRVTAVRPGRASVFAVAGGKVGRASLTVPPLPVASLEVRMPDAALRAGESVQAGVVARNRLGDEVPVVIETVEGGDRDVARADASGRIYGVAAGETRLQFRAGSAATTIDVRVAENPADRYEMVGVPTTAVRTGDVVRLRVSALEGRREVGPPSPLWLTDSAGGKVVAEGMEGVFVAERPGVHHVTALIGQERSVSAVIRVEPRAAVAEADLVLLGRGVNADHHSGDTWAFEGVDGRDYAYIGTFLHDWMRVWDVTDPTAPVLTDSMQLDARRINDVKIHPNGRIGILTREQASSRRNGIVMLDLSDPAHPTILSEYEETVTGGVHNVWVDGEHDLVYACHNGTGELHIIDISDPANPSEVGRWGLGRRSKTLHDVIVQDGYAYLSYWDDGLVILDAGAGTHGGTPTTPSFVSRIAYPAGHTHTAFRYGRYVFVGDEIFPSDWDPTKPIEARGYIHVIDVENIDGPVEVGRYEVPEAGAHNIWVEDDRLYVGYYQAGLRVVDISGELRGDLYRQGRELAVLKTGAVDSMVPNWGMTWGAQLHKGSIFTSDLNSGLWIARMQPQALVP